MAQPISLDELHRDVQGQPERAAEVDNTDCGSSTTGIFGVLFSDHTLREILRLPEVLITDESAHGRRAVNLRAERWARADVYA
jgi:hypothetical protein